MSEYTSEDIATGTCACCESSGVQVRLLDFDGFRIPHAGAMKITHMWICDLCLQTDCYTMFKDSRHDQHRILKSICFVGNTLLKRLDQLGEK